jgi:hypothetical protein
MLTFAINSSVLGETYDEILLNGRYGIEFIKEEIKKADKIISVHNISVIENNHRDNMGFVIMQENTTEMGNVEYRYIAYYLGDKSINRVAYNKNDPSYPNKKDIPGYNIVCDNVISIEDINIDFESGIIDLNIVVGNNNAYHRFRSTIAVRCPVDY